MPTYQYSCTECGHFFEQVQSFSEDSLTVCPQCEGRLRKVFNAVGVVFKGSGFYRTDSRTDNRSAADKGEGGSSATGGGAAEKAPAATGGDGGTAPASGSTSSSSGSSSKAATSTSPAPTSAA